MSKEQIQKYVLIAVVAGAALYGYIFELYLPALKKVSEQTVSLEKKKSDLKEAETKAREFDKLQKDARKAELDLLFTMRRLPNFDNQPEYIKEISRAAGEYNVTIQSFTPGVPVAGKSFYNEVPINISMIGNYNDFGKFINKLGYSVRLINCFDVQFATTGTGGTTILSKGTVNLSVNIRTFVSTQVITNQSQYSKGDDLEERAIFPLYRYFGSKRDPFVSINTGTSKILAENINISSLKMTGVMALGKTAIFVFEDELKNAYLLIDRKLYTKDKELIKGIEGRVDENKVKLAYVGNKEAGNKESSFEIPK